MESYLTLLASKLIMPKGMHAGHTLVGMLSPFQPIDICIEP